MLWRKFADGIYAHQWEELVRKSIHNAEKLHSLLCEDDIWLPAGRWWRENLPEWDIVAINLQGDAALLGEVKWSEKPFSQREITQLAYELTTREQPHGLPEKKVFAIVVPEVRKGVVAPEGILLLTGDDILKASRF